MRLPFGGECYPPPVSAVEPVFVNSESRDWVGVVVPGQELDEVKARELLESEGYDVADWSEFRQDRFLRVPVPVEHEGEFSSWWERSTGDADADAGWVLEA